MKILGIETSCDETAAAIVENGSIILSNKIATSAEMHTLTGGIIPENAARRQIEVIMSIISQAGVEALGHNYEKQIDAIAVTVGPGLIGSLLVGVETAKTLSAVWHKPLIPVNHLIAHVYANYLDRDKSPQFPALALVVSGGHTDLVLMKNHYQIDYIGGTKDDASGEAFDKTARILGLPYPGGPAIAQEADKFFAKVGKTASLTTLPRPMQYDKGYDFSFSGLKTAVVNKSKENAFEEDKTRFAAEIQEAIVDVLVYKSIKAIKEFKPESFLLSGGVAANSRLRDKLKTEVENQDINISLFIPHPKYCTDNAASISSAAYFHFYTENPLNVCANPNLKITDNLRK